MNMEDIKELYLEILPVNMYKGRRSEIMIYKHCLRGFLHYVLKMDYSAIARLESELYGGKVNHTTIMNSAINYVSRKEEYPFAYTIEYIASRFFEDDSAATTL